MKATKKSNLLDLLSDVHVISGATLGKQANVSRSYLKELADHGDIERVGRGLYTLPSATPSPFQGFVEVAASMPDAVICLLSALRFHDIGNQLPWQVWVAMPTKKRSYVPTSIRVSVERVSMDPNLLNDGLEEHMIEGVAVRIHSVEKALTDCFRYAARVRTEVAVEALRDSWQKNKINMDSLYDYASHSHVWKKMLPYLHMVQQL